MAFTADEEQILSFTADLEELEGGSGASAAEIVAAINADATQTEARTNASIAASQALIAATQATAAAASAATAATQATTTAAQTTAAAIKAAARDAVEGTWTDETNATFQLTITD
jgi:hypothetical protein